MSAEIRLISMNTLGRWPFVHSVIALVLASSSVGAGAPQSLADLAVVGGRLIDGYGGPPLDNAVILVRGNRVEAVGQVGQLSVPEGARVLDANGMTVLPGLWESHGHLTHVGEGNPPEFLHDFQGSKDVKFANRLMEVMAKVAETTLLAGITTFRDTAGPLEEQVRLKKQVEVGDRLGPRLYLAGPILNQGGRNPSRTEGEYFIHNPQEAKALVRKLVEQKADQIKVYGFWDLPVLEAVTTAAHEARIGVDADVRHMEAYRTAIAAGVDRLHHVFTADALSDYSDEDMRQLVRGVRPQALGPSGNILRGPYMVPTIEMRRSYVRVFEFPEILDHPRLRASFAPDLYAYLRETWKSPQSVPWGIGAPERVKVAMAKLRRFIAAGGREQIVAGTDAGTPFNFHPPLPRELENLVEAGLSPMEAIQSATLRAAQMQGVDGELGTIAPGKLADIIVVDGDPLRDVSVLRTGVAHVVKDGRVIR